MIPFFVCLFVRLICALNYYLRNLRWSWMSLRSHWGQIWQEKTD